MSPADVEYLPSTHASHVPKNVAPVWLDQVPAGQLMQSVCFVLRDEMRYVPAGHLRQVSIDDAPEVEE
jgi:hypothetical protein